MNINFPAYRKFKRARIEAIDAMTAFLIGSRLNVNLLESADNPSEMLPNLYGNIEGISRLNRSASDAARLLHDGEKHLVYMAIPYGLSVYTGFLFDVANMLREDGHEPRNLEQHEDLTIISLDKIHEYISDCCHDSLDTNYLSLFQLIRRVRNRIIHNEGMVGSHLEYSNLPSAAKQIWVDLARRPLTDCIKDNKLVLEDSELIAVLGVCNKLADQINALLQTTINRSYWALLAVKDYKELYPKSFKQSNHKLKDLQGYSLHYYRPLNLSPEELSIALSLEALS